MKLKILYIIFLLSSLFCLNSFSMDFQTPYYNSVKTEELHESVQQLEAKTQKIEQTTEMLNLTAEMMTMVLPYGSTVMATAKLAAGGELSGADGGYAMAEFIPGVGFAGKVAKGGKTVEKGMTLYRAFSKAELDDILIFGLRNKAGAYETGKLFTPTATEAARFGRNNFMFDGLSNTIIRVRVPNDIMQKSYMFGADGMNAVSIPSEYLHFLKATPLKYTPIP